MVRQLTFSEITDQRTLKEESDIGVATLRILDKLTPGQTYEVDSIFIASCYYFVYNA
ncbi:hypothetical protein SAMN05421858_4384 [Haladaptatus litoreus]|uniref:Uncharacterized protein n=1 Tax=Haladaptatus litoreus TaxID=553468 RepID=A0A1N7ELR7_9EURY|nr:hypothetical protein SAMN05421858_4384 [Haladaptatus litoreus]